jgi:hypothetical protein
VNAEDPEEPEEWESPPRTFDLRTAFAIVVVVLAGAAVSFWLVSTRSNPAAQSHPPVTATGPRRPPCNDNELAMAGAFLVCAHQVSDPASACTVSGKSLVAVSVISDGVSRYILYVDGGTDYHGPGSYVLQPWPEGTLGDHGGPVKVALRTYARGDLWTSTSGRLDVAAGARGGRVTASLAPARTDAGRALALDGSWTC